MRIESAGEGAKKLLGTLRNYDVRMIAEVPYHLEKYFKTAMAGKGE